MYGMGYGGALVKDGKLSLSISLFAVGDGAHILFWHNKWTGDVPFKILYPKLFLCSANKEACISEVLRPPVDNNDRVWSLSFHRDFNG